MEHRFFITLKTDLLTEYRTQNFYQDIDEAILLKIDKWKFGRFENEHLPYKTYRTYHPNYLNRASSKVLTAEQKDLIFNFFKKQVM